MAHTMTMRLERPLRNQLAAGLLIGFALFSCVRLMVNTGFSGLHSFGRDNTSIYLSRYDDLRDQLKGVIEVGYVSDTGVREYYLSQYALAPLVVARDSLHYLVIGNYKAADSARAAIENDALYRIELDMGNGLFLLRKNAP